MKGTGEMHRESRYRTLVRSIDQGFCVVQMVFDDRGDPVDYRFLEVNPAFERLTGMPDVVGRTARELMPDLEQSWFDIYGRVATTGEPVRFELAAEALAADYDVNAFRIDRPEDRRVGILFADVTDRKRRERHSALLDALTRDFAVHATPEEITRGAGERLADYLDLASVSFLDVDETREKPFILRYFWGREGIPDLRGEYNIRDFLSEEFERVHRAGETWIVRDTATDPHSDDSAYAPLQVRSFVSVPFIDQGVWTHYFVVSDRKPRDWRPDEIELIEEVGHRVFPRIERARAEAELLEARIEHEADLRSRRRIGELLGSKPLNTPPS